MSSRDLRRSILEAGDISSRDIQRNMVLPMIPALGLLELGWIVQTQRMQAPIGRGWVIALNGIGACALLCAGVCLAITLLVKLSRRLPDRWEWPGALTAVIAGFVGVCVLGGVLTDRVYSRYVALEKEALRTRGRTGDFRIEGRRYRGAKPPRWELFFRVPDQQRNMLRLSVWYPATDPVETISSVRIRYLPANPRIFESLAPGN